jgi:membrane protein
MAAGSSGIGAALAGLRGRAELAWARVARTLVWRVWERMLEIEFVDRSVALAGKAFVAFFPLVIVIAAFLPAGVRSSILAALTHRLGVRGQSLRTVRQAFATSNDVRRATGVIGIVFTVFYATSFTTALQRVYLRAWRRPSGGASGTYTRGPAWLLAALAFMAASGALSTLFGGALVVAFLVLTLATTTVLWWFTAWFMLKGEVKWRALLPTGLITAIANGLYTIYATVWMPHIVDRNRAQFGFFGIALALVSWFSGAAICLVIGACAGPVLAQDEGWIGRWVRGSSDEVLVRGAPPALAPPDRGYRLRDALTPVAEEETPA